MSSRARVVVYYREPVDSPGSIEGAYARISTSLRGTPGLLDSELLRSVLDPDGFAVISEWASLAAFRQWERGGVHKASTAPLRAYQDTSRPRRYEVYEIAADLNAPAPCTPVQSVPIQSAAVRSRLRRQRRRRPDLRAAWRWLVSALAVGGLSMGPVVPPADYVRLIRSLREDRSADHPPRKDTA